MLYAFENKNVGPMIDSRLDFGKKLNVLTGDNSTGKSFLLDLIWFGLTRCWPAEVNKRLVGGFPARPWNIQRDASLAFAYASDILDYLTDKRGNVTGMMGIEYERTSRRWDAKPAAFPKTGLLIYMMADGSFAVHDPLRNSAFGEEGMRMAYVLSPNELWPNELSQKCDFCNGVLADWASWQRDIDQRLFHCLEAVIKALYPLDSAMGEGIAIAPLVHAPTEHGGDQPVVRLLYGDVQLRYASSSIKRMAALAYVLVWAVSEHLRAAEYLGIRPHAHVTLLLDEIESHLHPRWQRSCVKGITTAIEELCKISNYGEHHVQAFVSTHSPLVMASLEDAFYKWNDGTGAQSSEIPNCKWFDFDLDVSARSEDGRCVVVHERPFAPQGTAEAWLMSEAFNLKATALYSPEVEAQIDELNRIFEDESRLHSEITGDSGQALKNKVNALLARLPIGDPHGYVFERKLKQVLAKAKEDAHS